MFNRRIKNQLLSTLCGNLLAMTFGASCGWPSASLPELQSNQSPLLSGPMTVEQGAWVSSLICVGGFFGNFFWGWIANKFGRKTPLLTLAFPYAISFLFYVFSPYPEYIYVGRFLGGFAGAGTFVLISLYIAEISDDNVRGFLGSLVILTTNIGYIITFTLGNFTNCRITSAVLIILPVSFGIGFLFVPDTPQALLKRGREREAKNSLCFYRNIRKNSTVEEHNLIEKEIDKIKSIYKPEKSSSNETESLTIKDFNYPAAKKAFLIGVTIMSLNQLNGAFPMLTYTATIFADAGSSLSPNVSAIIIGVIQLIGSLMSSNLVERVGRKTLLGISLFGTGFGVAILGAYTHCKSLDINVESYRWIPIAAYGFSIFIANLGILNLPFLIVAEIMPEKIRSIGTTVCMTITWVISFLLLKYFPIISLTFGMYTCFYGFAIFSLTGTIFVFTFMPETKGRSFEEIFESLGGR